MNKKMILCLPLVFAVGWLVAQEKLGFVNPARVLENSIKGKEIKSRLEATRSASQKRIEGLQKEIDALEKELSSPALNPDTRGRKAIDLQGKRTALSRAVEDARSELAQKRQKELSDLEREIMPILEKIAKDEGYTMIFDVSGTGIAYARPGADVTDKVIAAFDAKSAAAKNK